MCCHSIVQGEELAHTTYLPSQVALLVAFVTLDTIHKLLLHLPLTLGCLSLLSQWLEPVPVNS